MAIILYKNPAAVHKDVNPPARRHLPASIDILISFRYVAGMFPKNNIENSRSDDHRIIN
jgi:hypothetical protein